MEENRILNICKNCGKEFYTRKKPIGNCNPYCTEQTLSKERLKKWAESTYTKATSLTPKQRRKIGERNPAFSDGDKSYMIQFKAIRG